MADNGDLIVVLYPYRECEFGVDLAVDRPRFLDGHQATRGVDDKEMVVVTRQSEFIRPVFCTDVIICHTDWDVLQTNTRDTIQ